ncbi:filamentous haemagglutinin family protein [Caulobacter endophyticus]|uniref:filamentous haemagglutinin family protein n=1 Tax=Caulobacter endophyticus TaxID=2172652 RepID=UPI00240EA90F|nr:filamentous haemagglutinin family protein [Caulobacter endophyticus]MDG2527256.1 filamentous hemagglutinin family protein [Caulobacter endophyticus]
MTMVATSKLPLSTIGRARRALFCGASVMVMLSAGAAGQASADGLTALRAGARVPATGAGVPSVAAPVVPGVTPNAGASAAATRGLLNATNAQKAVNVSVQAQAAARQAAAALGAAVPDGLGKGGLNPAGSGTTGSGLSLWYGAKAPTQTTSASGQIQVDIKQTDSRAILSWETFNVGTKTTLNFDQSLNGVAQPDWVVLNRVTGGLDPVTGLRDPSQAMTPSQILGAIKAQGTVLVINQNGVLFGGTAQINTRSLIASSLEVGRPARLIGSVVRDTSIADRNAEFLTGGLLGIGTQDSNTTGLQTFSALTGADGRFSVVAEGAVTVEAGAQITAADGGLILLVGPKVVNAGSLSATRGQVSLASGRSVLLTASEGAATSVDPNVRGLVVKTTNAAGRIGGAPTVQDYVRNTGLIRSAEGYVSLNASKAAGAAINEGVITATTSVSRNGHVLLNGADVRVAPASVIAITPDDTGVIPQDATSLANFKPSKISLGDTETRIEVGAGSLIYAPGATIDIGAKPGIATEFNASTPPGASRIFIDSGAVIDAAGLKNVSVAASRNTIVIDPVKGNELADSPLLRKGFLNGATVYLDPRLSGVREDGVAWVGSPLISAESYALQVGVTASELMTKGGNVTLGVAAGSTSATGVSQAPDVIVKRGASIDISGGWRTFEAGRIRSTRLVDASGAIVDIGYADPDQTYIGIYEGYVDVQPRFGLVRTYTNLILDGDGFAGSYREGADAGSLTIKSSQPLLEGTVYADAFPGELQRLNAQRGTGKTVLYGDRRAVQAVSSQMPVGGYLSIQELGLTANGVSGGGDIVISDGATPTRGDGLDYGQTIQIDAEGNLKVPTRSIGSMLAAGERGVLVLGADTLSAMGLGQLSLSTSGGLTLERGAELALSPGGVFTATTGRSQKLDGDITAASGLIRLETVNAGKGSVFKSEAAGAGSYDVVVNGRLSTAGLWTNDLGAGPDTVLGSAFVDGGAVEIIAAPRELLTTTVDGVVRHTDISGNILVNGPRSAIDVSSGGYVATDGSLVLTAKGGDVTLTSDTNYFQIGPSSTYASAFRVSGAAAGVQANPDRITARVALGGGVIKAHGFAGGGTFALTTPAISLGEGEAATGTALPLDFFSTAGFSTYAIKSYATNLSSNVFANGQGGYNAVLATQVVTIGEGQVLDLSQSRYLPRLDGEKSSALRALGTGGKLTSVLTAGKPAEAWDQLPVSLTFGGLVELKVEKGGQVTGAPGSSIGAAQILNQGTIRLAGGAINQVKVLPSLYGPTRDGGRSSVVTASSLAEIFTIRPDGLIDESAPSKIDPSRTNGQVAAQSPIYLTADLDADVGVRLDAGSVTDLSGISVRNPYVTATTQGRGVVNGRIYGGGTLSTASTRQLDGDLVVLSPFSTGAYATFLSSAQTLTLADVILKTSAQAADLIATPGASLDLSGASDTFDQLQAGGRYVQAAQWSDGGALTLGGGAVLAGARINARGGAPTAAGGMLTLVDATLVQTDAGAPVRNRVSADQIQAAGFDTLVVRGTLGAQGDVDLVLDGAFVLASRVYDGSPRLPDAAYRQSLSPVLSASGRLDIAASYVRLDGAFQSLLTPEVGASGAGEVTLRAETMDVSGAVLFDRSVARATFDVAGDLRLSGVSPYQLRFDQGDATPSLAGQLAVNGDLTLKAGQVYATTGSTFSVTSAASDGVLRIERASATTPVTPYSAGSRLTLQADTIVQNGVLRAPVGALTLGSNTALTTNGATFAPVTRSVTLGDGGITSVSAGGLSIPYGVTTDQTEYFFTPTNGSPLTAPPTGVLTLAGATVATKAGATVDLSGGGDVYAYEFIPGPGGSRDVLSRYNTDAFSSKSGYQYADGRQVYAIVPGLSNAAVAAYDPLYSANYGDLYQAGGAGRRVYLDGGAGLAAGWYTLLPAQYAMLPGGMRVVENTGADNPAVGGVTTRPDGTVVTTGRYGGLGGAGESTVRVFEVQNQTTIRASSNIVLTSANAVFAAAAAKRGETAPALVRDAGRLVLAPLASIDLNGRFLAAPAEGGRGGQADISGRAIEIVSSLGTPTAGVVQLDARQLSALGMESLLIGGARTDRADGTTALEVTAGSITVANNAAAPLSGAEIVLAVDGDGATITLEDGAAILASGGRAGQRTGDYVIDARGGATGQGALVRVASGADRDVTRANPGAGGVLKVGDVDLKGGSILLDSSDVFTIDNDADLVADTLRLGASTIRFADAQGASGGLVLTPQLQAALARSKALALRTAGVIEFADGDYRFGDLTLSTPGLALSNPGGAVRILANGLWLENHASALTGCVAACGAGVLTLEARTISFGDGSLRTYGAGRGVVLTAREGVFYEGKATFDVGAAPLTLHTPFVGDRAAKDPSGAPLKVVPSLVLATTGAVVVDNLGGASRPSVTGVAGAGLSISGQSLSISGVDLRATAGKLTLTAVEGLNVGAGAILQTPGYGKAFGDATDPYSVSAPGGSLTLVSTQGDVVLGSGSTVSVGGGAGAGGLLSVKASRGSATFAGTIDATTPDGGARFELDTGGAFDLSNFVRSTKGGFDGGLTAKTGVGDLVLAEGLGLKARNVALVADGGAVIVAGSIDASGVNGGEIGLFGASGVTLGSKAVLDARALGYADTSTRVAEGGTVRLGTAGNGTIGVAAGARIELGARRTASRLVATVENGVTNYRRVEADRGGELVLRAPVLDLAGSQTVNVDFGGVVSGADSVVLEGYRAFDLAAVAGDGRFTGVSISGAVATLDVTATAAGRVNFLADRADGTLADFIQDFDLSAAYGRLGGLAGQANFHARPGVELNHAGSIVLASNWNFGAGTVDVAGATAAGLMAAHPGISGAVYVLPGSEGRILADYTTMTYRVGGKASGEAGVLTLRAGGDVDIKGSVTDGFFTFADQSDPAFLTRAVGGGVRTYNGYLASTCPGGCVVGDFTTGTAPTTTLTVTFPAQASLPNVEVTTGNPAPYNAAANSAAALGNGVSGAGDPIGSAELFPLIDMSAGQQAVQSWSYQVTAGASVSDTGAFSVDPTRVQAGSTAGITVAGQGSYSYGGGAPVTSFSNTLLLGVANGGQVSADQWVQAQLAQNRLLTASSYTRLVFSAAPVAVRTALAQRAAAFFAGHPGAYTLTGPANAPTGVSTSLELAGAFLASVANDWAGLKSAYTPPRPATPSATTVVTAPVIRTGTGSIGLTAAGDIDLRNGATPIYRNPTTGALATATTGYQVGGVAVYTAGHRVVPSALDALDPVSGAALTLDPGAYSQPLAIAGGVVRGVARNQPVYASGGGDVSLTAGGDVLGRRDTYTGAVSNALNSSGALAFMGSIRQPWRMGQVGMVTDIRINPQLFTEGLGTLGGGDIRVSVGGDLSDLSMVADTTVTTADVRAADGLLRPGRALLTFGGGDISVDVAGDMLGGRIDMGAGAARIRVGGDLGAAGLTQTGTTAPQAVELAANTLRLRLTDATIDLSVGGDATIQSISALGVRRNMTLTGGLAADTSNANALAFYSAEAGVSILANGAVTISNSGPEAVSVGGVNNIGRTSNNEAIYPGSLTAVALSGDLSFGAKNQAAVLLYPTARGTLVLAAGGDISPVNIAMLDEDPGLVPGVFSSFSVEADTVNAGRPFDFPSVLSSTSLAQRRAQHNPLTPHLGDQTPNRIYAGGDILDMIVATPKQTRIGAGRDIVNMMFFGQNLDARDVTRIVAGRDITATTLLTAAPVLVGTNVASSPARPTLQGNTFVIGGPGVLSLEAGRDLGPFLNSAIDSYKGQPAFGLPDSLVFGGGVMSVGNEWNPWLAAQGADLWLQFGVAKGANFDAVRETYVNPANLQSAPDYLFVQTEDEHGVFVADKSKPIYGPKLIEWMRANEASALAAAFGSTTVTYEQAYQAFTRLSALRQRGFLQQVYFNELTQTSTPGASFQKYSRGYTAVNTLFPAALGYTANDLTGGSNGANRQVWTGDLDLRLATLQTARGGDISILGPGGRVLAGSTVSTAQQAARRNFTGRDLYTAVLPIISGNRYISQISAIPIGFEGVLTLRGGSISSFTDGDFILNQSRLFTQQGGDVAMWSSNGDLNAGQGPKTSANFPPAVVKVSDNAYVELDQASAVSGAGIAAFQPALGVAAPDVYLIAPRGTVDAGDAGVRVAGNLFVAALTVANADNFKAGGSVIGVPTAPAPPAVGTEASAANSAATQAAQQAVGGRDRTERSIITVEVLGFGDEPCEDPNDPLCKR